MRRMRSTDTIPAHRVAAWRALAAVALLVLPLSAAHADDVTAWGVARDL